MTVNYGSIAWLYLLALLLDWNTKVLFSGIVNSKIIVIQCRLLVLKEGEAHFRPTRYLPRQPQMHSHVLCLNCAFCITRQC